MGSCREYSDLTRRQVLAHGAAGMAALTAPAWMPRLAFAAGGPAKDVLVVIFLRGGADGLSICVPFGDPNYYVHRTNLAVARPDSASATKAINLDGFFGMHPSLSGLQEAWHQDDLLFVHATGATKNQAWSRSHFDAMRWMELGKPNDASIFDGWLGRHLGTSPIRTPGAGLRGISITYGLSESMRGGPQTLPIPYPEYFDFDGWYPHKEEMIDWLKGSYQAASEPIKSSAKYMTDTVDVLNTIDFDNYAPAGGAVYPDQSEIGRGLKSAAAIMRAQIGVETICLDYGAWDTHSDQGTNEGFFRDHLQGLGNSLGAFYTDLMAAGRTDFTVVVMSEFGRTVVQNATGTDHGTANMMMLLGPKVAGGRVMRNWPGLATEQLVDQQDLKVTIDYRDIIAEVVKKRLSNDNLGSVFPGFAPQMRGAVLDT